MPLAVWAIAQAAQPDSNDGSPAANGGGGFDPNAANRLGRLISVQLQKSFD